MKIKVVFDIQVSCIKSWVDSYQIEYIIFDYCELLYDLDIDVVFICLLIVVYVQMIREVVEVKKYIFCEKFVSFCFDEIKEVFVVVWKYGVVF